MDRINVAVLDKICSLASPGRYVVFSEDELEEALPEDGGDLKKSLKALSTAGYIDIKYSSGNLFCIAPIKKYVEPEPDEDTADGEKPEKQRGASPFFPAFFGGALGSLLVTLVFAILGYA